MIYLPFLIYPFLALAQFGLTLIAWGLAPFLAWYPVAKGVDTLPGRWQWWSTFDDNLDGGIHQGEYPDYSMCSLFVIWWYRTRWIWRNPAQGFGYHLFGADTVTPLRYHWKNGVDVYGVSNSACCTSEDAKGRCYFSLKGKWWPVKWIGLRYYLGWKLTRTEERKMLVASLSIRLNKS